MPLFFLLSGFSLTLAYGKKKYKKSTFFSFCHTCSTTPITTCNSIQCSRSEDVFESWDFYYERMVRILPVYYTVQLFAIILLALGYGDVDGSTGMRSFGIEFAVWGSVSALFGIQMWIMMFGFGPTGPAWFISTLFFFYLLFPRLELQVTSK